MEIVSVNPLDTINLPQRSRWKIIEEIAPAPGKLKSQRFFRVRCTCGSGIEKDLAYKYIAHNQSLSCGCIRRERGIQLGRARLSPLKIGYQKYLEEVRRNRPPSKYAPKLPTTDVLIEFRKNGLSNKEIASKYGSSVQAVRKRLASIASGVCQETNM